ncbi:MAG: hypothetical protein GF331_25395, partial [Chitinivibrionales bacterium]|nr:hypothetical protein [Chitinivibrionales bacterium]
MTAVCRGVGAVVGASGWVVGAGCGCVRFCAVWRGWLGDGGNFYAADRGTEENCRHSSLMAIDPSKRSRPGVHWGILLLGCSERVERTTPGRYGFTTGGVHMPNKHPSYYTRSIAFPSGDRFWNCQADTFLHNLPIAIMYSGLSLWGPGRSFERAESDIFSVELVTAGNIELTQDSNRQVVEPGCAFVLRKGGRHRFVTGPAGFAHKRMAVVDGVMLDMAVRSLGIEQHDVIRLDNPRRLERLIKESYRLVGNREQDYIWRLSTIAYEILLELGRNVLYQGIPRQVALALDYMN